ncbi:cysteine--tRNA ligase [Candidatus Parcubacteria bacterium]|nr:MAG: cysteine--tRNA ligase [Candidatus Parcubacteria bacterium]
MLKLYNSLTRRTEIFRPLKKDRVGFYTCGPTVYNYAHIGNLRTYIFEDVLERVLERNGYRVKRVMNVTDVGHLTGDSDSGRDKVEEVAKRERKTVREIATAYTKAFLSDIKSLNIRIPGTLAPATRYVPDQVALVRKLFGKGLAYETEKAVYFDVKKYGVKKYLRLSRQPLSGKRTGARANVVVDAEKKNPYDFALWFKTVGKFERHILRWPSPWGAGFPGWHIECSAISRKLLGQPFDIHAGGVDLIGTHHTNEIAQSEGAYGRPLARWWVHGEFLLVDKAKMAKSAGNFFTLADIKRRGTHPLALRYLALQTHYRSKLNFSWESLDAAGTALSKLNAEYHFAKNNLKRTSTSRKPAVYWTKFETALNDDLNTPRALAVLWEVLGSDGLAPEEKAALARSFDAVFGLLAPVKIPGNILNLAKKREQCRKSKQFIQSDALRKRINDLGYTIEDTPEGPRLWPRKPI